MKAFLRKLRGLFGVGATWGALWGLIGAGVGVVIGVVRPEVWGATNPIIEWAVGIGLYGFVSGVGFGTLLALREGRSTLLDLSLKRSAVWGVLGALAVPLLFGAIGMFDAGTTVGDVLGAILVTGSLGGVFAPASIAAARRGELKARDEATMLGHDSGEPTLPDRLGSE